MSKLKKKKEVAPGPIIGISLSRQCGDDNYGNFKATVSIEGITVKKPGLAGIQESFDILQEEVEKQLEKALLKSFNAQPER